MGEPRLPVKRPSPWDIESELETRAVLCAICWRTGHVAKLCPYTAIGRLRQHQRGIHGANEPRSRFTIEILNPTEQE